MKRIITLMLCIIMILPLSACGKNGSVKNTVSGNMKTYYFQPGEAVLVEMK